MTLHVLFLLIGGLAVVVEGGLFRDGFSSLWTTSPRNTATADQQRSATGGVLVRPAHHPAKPAAISAAEAALIADLQRKSSVSACWKDAVVALRDGCKLITTFDEKRSRVALQFLHCQVQLDGKRSSDTGELLAVSCSPANDVKHCVQRLDESMYPLYVQFRLHVDSLCFHAQEELFQERTEVAVFELARAADTATSRLHGISAQTEGVSLRLDDLQLQHNEAALMAKGIRSDLANHAAQQTEALDQLSDTTIGVLTGIESARAAADRVVAAQQEGLALIRDDLGAVATQQSLLFDATRTAAISLHDLVGRSSAELEGHRRLIESVSAATRLIAQDANEQHQKVEKANQAIIDVLEHVHGMQTSVHGTVNAVSTGLFYIGLLFAVMLLTATPRTCDARGVCLTVTVAGAWIEAWIGVRAAAISVINNLPNFLSEMIPHAAFAVWGSEQQNFPEVDAAVDVILQRSFRGIVAAILLLSLVHSAATYVSPDEKLRRFLKAELQALFGPRLAAADAILQQQQDEFDQPTHWIYDARTGATTFADPLMSLSTPSLCLAGSTVDCKVALPNSPLSGKAMRGARRKT